MDGPLLLNRLAFDPEGERRELLAGLLRNPASIPPKYFYDELGCALYGAICRLPEYYPTRTEVALFQARRLEIAEAIGPGRQFVDLGAGDCCKAKGWLPVLDPSRYVAVDIAIHEITAALDRLAPDFPGLELVGVATDFARALELDGVLADSPALFFYPGSSIGNFTPAEARVFLARIRHYCVARPGSSLLIGVDGKKEKALLDAAYDDALGVTAAFNRNMLRHLNVKFGLGFDVNGFAHVGFYNEAEGRIEMHLESLREQAVLLDGQERRFAKGERIHTENSYKYDPAEFEQVLSDAGFASIRRWDAAGVAYSVYHAA
ncbi:MAG TPA: L-histidine N(alpha)-methyltransferase [Usitatibacteraceae bacterium]|nr:L-histidine N(alpha)-methyltransferase [Usitatibacteraceae bacterium]